MCSFSVPLTIFQVLAALHNQPNSVGLCLFTQAVYTIATKTINWSDAILALNSFVAFFFPHHYKACNSPIETATTILFTWFISVSPVVLMELGLGGSDRVLPVGQCAYLPAAGSALGNLITGLSLAPNAKVDTLAALRSRAIFLQRRRMAKVLLLMFL
ncbi:hypothetical protein BV898_00109 [Hypsibius exemplaris]|uniref:7TM GPCR serpentine receptor class x (Srx) domain-containing protein n=1 Tax=Hypsibius exemplaris TaxID=2072580 RepID=A0A1W0XF43_HYPEX|nr:hypothetical protein BV898_00109 [Hypsibius exemplaris]